MSWSVGIEEKEMGFDGNLRKKDLRLGIFGGLENRGMD